MITAREVITLGRPRRAPRYLTVSILVLLAAAVLWSATLREGTPPGGTPEGREDQGMTPFDPLPNPIALRDGDPSGQSSDPGEPRNLADLEAAILATIEALERPSWNDASSSAGELRQVWLSFKRPMRAQGGERIWNATDVDAFEATMGSLEEEIRHRDQRRALAAARSLMEIAHRYSEGPRPTGDAGRTDGSPPDPNW